MSRSSRKPPLDDVMMDLSNRLGQRTVQPFLRGEERGSNQVPRSINNFGRHEGFRPFSDRLVGGMNGLSQPASSLKSKSPKKRRRKGHKLRWLSIGFVVLAVGILYVLTRP